MTPKPSSALWLTLAQLWRLTPQESNRCWWALYQATGTVPVTFRERLMNFEVQLEPERRQEVADFIMQRLRPQHVLDVLEALAAERVLMEPDRVQIETKVLAKVDRTGAWTYLQSTEGVSHG